MEDGTLEPGASKDDADGLGEEIGMNGATEALTPNVVVTEMVSETVVRTVVTVVTLKLGPDSTSRTAS